MHKKTIILLVIISFLWGYAWVWMKVGLDYFGPFTFAALRFGLGALVLLGILIWRKDIWIPGKEWPVIVMLGLCQTTLEYILLMYGMLFVTAGKASILIYSMPVWNMVLAYFFLGEVITSKKVASLCLGVLGLAMVMGWDFFCHQSIRVLFGESLIVLAAVSWAAANILMKKRFQNSDKVQVSAWQMAVGALGLVLVALLFEREIPVIFAPKAVVAIVFCGVFSSAICYTLWYFVLEKVDTTVASVSLLFIPVVAQFFGWLQLGEVTNLGTAVGTILICASIYFVSQEKVVTGLKKDIAKT